MKAKMPDCTVVMSVVWRQAPVPLVVGFLVNPLPDRPVYGPQASDDVLPSGVLDTRWWLTLATLVAIHHRFSPHASSKRYGFSIWAR